MTIDRKRPQSFALAVQEITELGLGLLPRERINEKGGEQSKASPHDSITSSPDVLPGSLPLPYTEDDYDRHGQKEVGKDEQMARMMEILGTLVDLYRKENEANPRQVETTKLTETNISSLGLAGLEESFADSDDDDSLFYSAVESQEEEVVAPLDNDAQEVEERCTSVPTLGKLSRVNRVSFMEGEAESSSIRSSPVKPLKSALRPLKMETEATITEQKPEFKPTFARPYRPRAATQTSPRSAPSMERMREEAMQSIAETQQRNDPMQHRNSVVFEGDNQAKVVPRSLKTTEKARPNSMLQTIEQEDSELLESQPPLPTSLIEQISYARESIVPRQDVEDVREYLVESFPDTCNAPYVVMHDTNGDPLPPLKHEETNEQERRARAHAMIIQTCATQKHCLVKSSVVIENRVVTWKRTDTPSDIPPSEDKQIRRRSSIWKLSSWKMKSQSSQQQDVHNQSDALHAFPLPPLPDGWSVRLTHEKVAALQSQKRSVMTLQMSNKSSFGLCPKCKGDRLEVCKTCKGSEADECFWCDGSGRQKHSSRHACGPCNGTGRLACTSCANTLRQTCKTCNGRGQGHFVVMLRVSLRLVKFAPKAIDERYFESDEEVRTFALKLVRSNIDQLIEACVEKHKRAFRPVSASCTVLTSYSDIVKVHIPQAIKLKKKLSRLSMRNKVANPSDAELALALKEATSKVRFFILPSDMELCPVELSERECEQKVAKLKQQALLPSLISSSASTPRIAFNSPMLDRMIGMRPMSILSRSSSQPTFEDDTFISYDNLAALLPTSSAVLK
jgi:hypothetical protein